MPSVSTDFSPNVQEDSHVSEFPKGIRLKPDTTYQTATCICRGIEWPVLVIDPKPGAPSVAGGLATLGVFQVCNRLQSVTEPVAPINIFVGYRRLANSV
jgi:hypothetical protein